MKLIGPDRRTERFQKLIWPDWQWRSDLISSAELISQISSLKNLHSWYSQIGYCYSIQEVTVMVT